MKLSLSSLNKTERPVGIIPWHTVTVCRPLHDYMTTTRATRHCPSVCPSTGCPYVTPPVDRARHISSVPTVRPSLYANTLPELTIRLKNNELFANCCPLWFLGYVCVSFTRESPYLLGHLGFFMYVLIFVRDRGGLHFTGSSKCDDSSLSQGVGLTLNVSFATCNESFQN